jgi:uncharacterized protein (TIGR02996 family)
MASVAAAEGSDGVEEGFLQALHAQPDDEVTWLALTDWLEEHHQEQRAELVRLVRRRLRALPLQKQTDEGDRMQARVAELLDAGVQPVVPEVINSVGMRFALIPPGSFLMGSPQDEEERSDHEGPQHEVEITRPFYLGVHQVTQAQWRAVMGSNPSYFSARGGGKDKVSGMNTDDFPVEQVSWDEVMTFLKKLAARKKEREKGRKYRLPTEAEWEYACRGGARSSSIFHYGNSLSSTQANFNGNYPYGGAARGPFLERTCKVGSYRPNAWGLYDMHGNVYEWCSDWYGSDYYKISPRRDPSGPSEGSDRVRRGGGWFGLGSRCRAAYRNGSFPSDRFHDLGFRVALVPAREQ